MRNLVKLILMVIILIPLVGATTPTTAVFSGDEGIRLEVIAPISVPTSTAINVTIHLFNATNGIILDANDYTCEGILFNPEGTLITTQTAGIVDDYAYFEMNESMATETGIYPYTFHCNDSQQGGFYISYFDVTESGVSLTTEDVLANVSFIMLLFGISIFFLIFARTTEEGSIKLFFNIIGYIILLFCIGTSYIFLQGVQTKLLSLNEGMLFIIGIIFVIIMFYIFINLTRTSLALMRVKKGFGSELDSSTAF